MSNILWYTWYVCIYMYICMYVCTYICIYVYICIKCFLYPSISCWSHQLFTNLVIVNKTAINIGMRVSLFYINLHFLGYVPKSGMTRLWGKTIFVVVVVYFLGNYHTDFHSDCTSLYSHKQRMKITFSPHSSQHLFVFLMMVSLTGMR
jgi:hypothetical protein